MIIGSVTNLKLFKKHHSIEPLNNDSLTELKEHVLILITQTLSHTQRLTA